MRVGLPIVDMVTGLNALAGILPEELRRVKHSLPGAKIVLADCGLTPEARGLAQFLADREKDAVLMDGKEFDLGA